MLCAACALSDHHDLPQRPIGAQRTVELSRQFRCEQTLQFHILVLSGSRLDSLSVLDAHVALDGELLVWPPGVPQPATTNQTTTERCSKHTTTTTNRPCTCTREASVSSEALPSPPLALPLSAASGI